MIKYSDSLPNKPTEWLWDPPHLPGIDEQSRHRFPNETNVKYVCAKLFNGGMHQNCMASVILEHYIAYYDFDYVVELGSAYGALSTYIANMAGASERFIFETYDCFRDGHWSNKPMGGIGHWFDKLSTLSPLINSFNKDVFSDEVKKHIIETSKNRRTLILCDGGDKVKEFALYSPILKEGDCIMVHDWGVEINQSDIDANNSHNLRVDPTFEPYFTTFETLWRPFIK